MFYLNQCFYFDSLSKRRFFSLEVFCFVGHQSFQAQLLEESGPLLFDVEERVLGPLEETLPLRHRNVSLNQLGRNDAMAFPTLNGTLIELGIIPSVDSLVVWGRD